MGKSLERTLRAAIAALLMLALFVTGGGALSAVSQGSQGSEAPVAVASAPRFFAQVASVTAPLTGVVQAEPLDAETKAAASFAQGAPAPIDQETLQKGGYFTPDLEVDAGGNLFVAIVRNDGGTAHGRVQRRNGAGQVTGSWEIRLGSIAGIQHKADGIAIVISGDDVLSALTSHGTNEGPRVMAVWGATIDNVAVPYAQGERPTGAPGGNLGVEPGAGDGATLQEISQLMDQKFAAHMAQLRLEIGGDSNNIRQGLEDKTKSAIIELNLWSQSIQDRGVDQWSMDRTYQVLRDNRLLPTPYPTAAPTRAPTPAPRR